MRVGLVSLHTSPLAAPGIGDAGGLNVYVVALAEALAERGVEVELLTRRTSPEQPEIQRTRAGVPVRFLDAGPPHELLKEDLPPIVGRFQSALAALPRFDVLHSHYWLSGLAALPVATMNHCPHIQSLHTVAALKNVERGADDRPEPQARLNAERLLVTRSAATIVSTPAERAAIEAEYGARPERMHVISPGVDTALFHPERPAYAGDRVTNEHGVGEGDSAREPFLLAIGRIQPLKGYELAIRAVAAIDRAVRPMLVIAGSPTPGEESYADGLVTLAAQLQVAEWVEFAGPQTRAQVAELMRQASLLLLTSHSETFGLVALEAAASGTPVVSTRTSGMAVSVFDGVSGVLLDDRDPVRWARVVTHLLTTPGALARLSASAAEYGSQHSWHVTADTTLALYNQLTA
ncbi:glycosyltransferase [Subtercola endophyticus]|uniref:glycosyltransferase n=1 Tax=Subtercola endophyticus TaxID=2895559 RepID=UPI001E5A41A7|nr:glycosyltransferase [Subtercola endophyticus]UFS61208.1 glycosyltransferase [Subtercola endophyticus]